MSEPSTTTTTTATTPDSRDQIRAKIFGAKPKGEILEVYGTRVEFRQPSLGAVLDNTEQEDRKAATIGMIIQFAYVPGTDQKVFDQDDYDAMLTLPFDDNIQAIQSKIADLTGALVTDATKSGAQAEQPEVGDDVGGPRAETPDVGSPDVEG